MNGFIRNAEKYYDPTAGAALSSVERWEKMNIKPGDVIRITKPGTATVDASFAVMGVNGNIYTGVRLYDTEVNGSVPVICGAQLYAQCEKLEWFNAFKVDVSFARTMGEKEYNMMREAVSKALCLDEPVPVYEMVQTETEGPGNPEYHAESINAEALQIAEDMTKDLIRARAEADIYRGLYEDLLGKCLKVSE